MWTCAKDWSGPPARSRFVSPKAEKHLEDAVGFLAGLLESSNKLGATLKSGDVDDAARDLGTIAARLNDMPACFVARSASLRRLKSASSAFRTDIEKMIDALKYMRAFSPSIKVRAGDTALDAVLFAGFAEVMMACVDRGCDQATKFLDDLAQLDKPIASTLDIELRLAGDRQTSSRRTQPAFRGRVVHR
jgi:hypothetical protein